MENNNWRELANKILEERYNYNNKSLVDCMLEAMNLVFEATKKECSYVPELFKEQSEKILNIEKPTLCYLQIGRKLNYKL